MSDYDEVLMKIIHFKWTSSLYKKIKIGYYNMWLTSLDLVTYDAEPTGMEITKKA